MVYNKTNWKTGDIITASGLNNLESGVSNNDTSITQLNTDILDRANTDLNNLSTTGKNSIAHYSSPDFTRVVQLTVQPTYGIYTAPADGYFCAKSVGNTTSACDQHLNIGPYKDTVFIQHEGATGHSLLGTTIPVSKGDEVQFCYNNITFTWAGYTKLGLFFIYAKGAE